VTTTDAEHVELVAGKGVVGDRFFGKAAHMDAAVTVFAVEALEAIATELGADAFDPMLTRRNVILRGAHLPPLVGGEFTLESGGEQVTLRAGRPAHPCAWMDRMLAPGAHAAMRGRGGVRCQPLSTGVLHRGPAVLVSPVQLDPSQAGAPHRLRPSRLP
jgi:MOSC domain-containing protein YiiM